MCLWKFFHTWILTVADALSDGGCHQTDPLTNLFLDCFFYCSFLNLSFSVPRRGRRGARVWAFGRHNRNLTFSNLHNYFGAPLGRACIIYYVTLHFTLHSSIIVTTRCWFNLLVQPRVVDCLSRII
jgi:hypothetical protein